MEFTTGEKDCYGFGDIDGSWFSTDGAMEYAPIRIRFPEYFDGTYTPRPMSSDSYSTLDDFTFNSASPASSQVDDVEFCPDNLPPLQPEVVPYAAMVGIAKFKRKGKKPNNCDLSAFVVSPGRSTEEQARFSHEAPRKVASATQCVITAVPDANATPPAVGGPSLAAVVGMARFKKKLTAMRRSEGDA